MVLSTPAIRSHDLLRALTDNFAHGLLAVWIWLLSAGRPTRGEDWLWLILCGASACAVDVDHFLAAGSWKLKVDTGHWQNVDSRLQFVVVTRNMFML